MTLYVLAFLAAAVIIASFAIAGPLNGSLTLLGCAVGCLVGIELKDMRGIYHQYHDHHPMGD